jgi:hypothetical protein
VQGVTFPAPPTGQLGFSQRSWQCSKHKQYCSLSQTIHFGPSYLLQYKYYGLFGMFVRSGHQQTRPGSDVIVASCWPTAGERRSRHVEYCTSPPAQRLNVIQLSSYGFRLQCLRLNRSQVPFPRLCLLSLRTHLGLSMNLDWRKSRCYKRKGYWLSGRW